MVKFDPRKLKELRIQKGMSVAEMAEKLGVSVQQAHRLEKGERRLTVDVLLAFCNELDVNVGHIFSQPVEVPITGIINELYEVLACPPNSPRVVRVPALVPDNTNLAAVRWHASGHISRISGQLAFYYLHRDGIPDNAWGNRCLIVRQDGNQYIGWLISQDGVTHIENPEGRTQFNVEVTWASPILAVAPPFVFEF